MRVLSTQHFLLGTQILLPVSNPGAHAALLPADLPPPASASPGSHTPPPVRCFRLDCPVWEVMILRPAQFPGKAAPSAVVSGCGRVRLRTAKPHAAAPR